MSGLRVILSEAFNKEADKKSDYLSDLLWATIFPPAAWAGTAAGFANPTPADLSEASLAKTWLPGVGSYRVGQRTAATTNLAKDPQKAKINAVSEAAGPHVNTVLATLLGLGVGAGVGSYDEGFQFDKEHRREILKKALAGAALGGVASTAMNVGSGIAAAITPHRTPEEQASHDETSHKYRNLLIPGYGTFEFLKRYGSAPDQVGRQDNVPV